MPRVNNIEACRKSPGTCGKCSTKIEIGEPYRWWKFRRSGKFIRCAKPGCAPKGSDLTQSDFWKSIKLIQEGTEFNDADSLDSDKDNVVSELQNVADETQGKFDNMPEGLQNGDTGQMLQERVDAVQSVIDTLESVDLSIDEGLNETEQEERVTEICDELRNALEDISCS